MNPIEILAALGAEWSPDFDAYTSGALDASHIRCVLCQMAPCSCPEFGTPEYFALHDQRRSRRGA
ncbi:hypothetical protein GT755_12515 [Herbidospora sp. NEAU-GS84]|uniref:Uncharacterized protein n=1 Tax=Herbidospora solisilvae TaxID=2696284 RepID=A0A7C9J283_9ACTN|nr:hypothetical protein [Herbidospora solisilvae]NAS22506.1 hypothetical protein [Herbidospora solisilvae]